MFDEDVQRLLASRKEAGLKIDPDTAEVCWEYGPVMDPYGVYSDLPEECQQVGRQYFARSPGSDIWVHFWDLPDETREVLGAAQIRFGVPCRTRTAPSAIASPAGRLMSHW